MKTSKDGCLFDVPAAIYGTPRRDRPVPPDAVPISHVVAIACGAPCMDAAEVESADAARVRRQLSCVYVSAYMGTALRAVSPGVLGNRVAVAGRIGLRKGPL